MHEALRPTAILCLPYSSPHILYIDYNEEVGKYATAVLSLCGRMP